MASHRLRQETTLGTHPNLHPHPRVYQEPRAAMYVSAQVITAPTMPPPAGDQEAKLRQEGGAATTVLSQHPSAALSRVGSL